MIATVVASAAMPLQQTVIVEEVMLDAPTAVVWLGVFVRACAAAESALPSELD